MSEIIINTSQNVNINFKTASIGERILAFGIDMVIKISYIIFIVIIEKYIFPFSKLMKDIWAYQGIIIILLLPFVFYTLVSELLMEGQTLGKKIVKIKVIKIDGYQATFGDYLMRWVFRLIDVYSNGGAVGLIAMIGSKHNQRLGDLATGTAVISLRNNINISHTILENITQDYIPTFTQVILLSDNDIRIIKDNFKKAVQTDDVIIINQLTQKIKSVLKVEQHQMNTLTNKQFIDTIIKDYNFFTGKEE